MSAPHLKQLLGRSAAHALLDDLSGVAGGQLAIEDRDGRVVYGTKDGAPERHPISLDGAALGWVSGSAASGRMAGLLGQVAGREAERRALGAEVLHLYREINLIYSFSEKLAAQLDLGHVARLTLQEARHLIVATDGLVMLLDEASGELTAVAGFGDELPSLSGFCRGRGIVGAVAASGIAEVVTDVDSDPRRITERTSLKALMCAPLKVGERVTGVLAIGSMMPLAYTAAELKLLTTLALQAATAIENARLFERTIEEARERERLTALHREAELARAKLDNELAVAARIQSDLFPAVMPGVPGYELAAHNRPARRCGGDYYDVLPLSGDRGTDRWLLCVADVAGKGLPAALVMSNTQATLRALLGRIDSLQTLAGEASALLFGSTPPEKYVTAALVDLHPASGEFGFVGAGHVDTLVLRADGSVSSLPATGRPLGLLPADVPYTETRGALQPGDTLVLFSDGVTEAQDPSEDEFGEGRLIDALRACAGQSAGEVVTHVLAAIDRFAAGAPQFDDITLLVAKRT